MRIRIRKHKCGLQEAILDSLIENGFDFDMKKEKFSTHVCDTKYEPAYLVFPKEYNSDIIYLLNIHVFPNGMDGGHIFPLPRINPKLPKATKNYSDILKSRNHIYYEDLSDLKRNAEWEFLLLDLEDNYELIGNLYQNREYIKKVPLDEIIKTKMTK